MKKKYNQLLCLAAWKQLYQISLTHFGILDLEFFSEIFQFFVKLWMNLKICTFSTTAGLLDLVSAIGLFVTFDSQDIIPILNVRRKGVWEQKAGDQWQAKVEKYFLRISYERTC